MISDFLKRQKNTLVDNQTAMEQELISLKTEKEETLKFIAILDEGRDKLLHTVSPYMSEDEDEKKIRELKKKLHTLEEQIKTLSEELQSLTKLLSEYDEYIDDAFDLEIKKGKYNQLSIDQLDVEKKEDFNFHLLSDLEQEKTNTARELFDSFSPLFTIATHRLDIAQRYLDVDPERSKKEIVDVSDTVENCISEMNRLLSKISPIDYQNKTLKDALEQEFVRLREICGVKMSLDYKIQKELSSKVICSSIFQMIQEACSCMMMHEKPSEIHVRVECCCKKDQQQIKIYISNLPSKNSQVYSSTDSSSEKWYQEKLCLIKEKIFLLAGDLEIKTQDAGKTDIVISIPYKD